MSSQHIKANRKVIKMDDWRGVLAFSSSCGKHKGGLVEINVIEIFLSVHVRNPPQYSYRLFQIFVFLLGRGSL